MPAVFIFIVSFNPCSAEGGIIDGKLRLRDEVTYLSDRKLDFLPRFSSSSKIRYSFT